MAVGPARTRHGRGRSGPAALGTRGAGRGRDQGHKSDAIELRATSDGTGQLRIEVEDEGCRVHEDALARIFDRFARAGPLITERPASRSAPTGAKLLERMDIDLAGVQGAVRDQRRRRHDTPPHS